MQRFLRLAGFLGAAAGTKEEQAKNFQCGLRRRGGSDNHRSNNNNYSGSNNRLNFKSFQSSSTHEHDPNTTVLSSPGVPLRATLTQYALLVDVDTKESVVELQ
nr:hypothetical protein [Tanacetum cinerariifolium]